MLPTTSVAWESKKALAVRTVLARRYWDRVKANQKRLRVGVKSDWRVRFAPEFIDYWSEVDATFPEKVLFGELASRQVNFYFSYYMGDFPFTTDSYERYRPDFILPDYRIVIEVAGGYWHTRPGMPEHDATKFAMLTAAGWMCYAFTDLEIIADVKGTLDQIPELVYTTIHGNFIGIGDRQLNPVSGILGRARHYPPVFTAHQKARIPKRNRLAAISTWKKGTRPPAWGHVAELAIFKPQEDFSGDYVKELIKYGQDWLKYMQDLGDWFAAYPSAKSAYPNEWRYYTTFKDWWTKYSAVPLSKELTHGR